MFFVPTAMAAGLLSGVLAICGIPTLDLDFEAYLRVEGAAADFYDGFEAAVGERERSSARQTSHADRRLEEEGVAESRAEAADRRKLTRGAHKPLAGCVH